MSQRFIALVIPQQLRGAIFARKPLSKRSNATGHWGKPTASKAPNNRPDKATALESNGTLAEAHQEQ